MAIMIRNAGAPLFRDALCEKGKPVARRGRKAYGPLFGEIAGLPNRDWGFREGPLRKGGRGMAITMIALLPGTSGCSSVRLHVG
jgi:hypothetical protein